MVVTRDRDKWLCGDHVLVCGDPAELRFAELTSGGSRAAVAFVDPFPWTTELKSEEMAEYMLGWSEGIAAQVRPRAMIYWFADWQQIGVLTGAVQPVFGPPRDMIAWVRSDARPGTLYPSQYDQVAVFVLGGGAPVHASALARKGRHRTNVWHEADPHHMLETSRRSVATQPRRDVDVESMSGRLSEFLLMMKRPFLTTSSPR